MLQSQASWCPGWKLVEHVPLVKAHINRCVGELSKDLPNGDICPRISRRLNEIKEMRYGKSSLVVGWLIVEGGDGQPVDWEARELKDSLSDLQDLGRNIVTELDERFQTSYSELNRLLHNCLDFGKLFSALCGTRCDGKVPVDKNVYSQLGAPEFLRCVKFVSQLPHVQDLNMELGTQLAPAVYWRLKTTLLEIIWGNMFVSQFPKFFKEIKDATKPGEKTAGATSIQLPSHDVRVTAFTKCSPKKFCLAEVFQVTLSHGEEKQVVFEEEEVIKALYEDSSFYSAVGREFCLIFDIMYAKTGTEAVAESFYRVVEMQEKDGGQSQEVLSMRAKVDWCFPPVIQCESALAEMANMYLNGDKERGLKRHHLPIYKDIRSMRGNSSQYSTVVSRIVNNPAKFPFLL